MLSRKLFPERLREASEVARGRYLDRPDPVGPTKFKDVFSASIDGRTVTVANALTYIDPGLFQAGQPTPSVAVCVAELARFQSLDPQRRMQIMAMFMRAQDG